MTSIDTTSLEEAINKVKKPCNPGYLHIILPYRKNFILPYEDGIKLLEVMKSAELFEYRYSEPSKISAIAQEDLSISMMSHSEYMKIKVGMILNLREDEMKDVVI